MKRILLVALMVPALLATAGVAAKRSDSLQHFFSDVKTFKARFNQVVLDEALNTLQESSGELWIQRPGKFRWNYELPFKQQIVGDGEQVWTYDVELQQVTVRPMHGALGYTPALLLAGKGRLKDNFEVTPQGTQGKLEWVLMKPKKNDGGFETIRIGFEDGVVRMLEMVDGFGQTTRVTLSDVVENKKIAKSVFSFTPPDGVDVVRQ